MKEKHTKHNPFYSHHSKVFSRLISACLLLAVLLLTSCAAQITPAQVIALATVPITAVSPTATSTAILPTITSTATSTQTPEPTFTVPPTDIPTNTATYTPVPTNTPMLLNTAVPPPAATATLPLPLPTPPSVFSWTLQVPILMYHYISIPPEGADKYRIDLSIPPENFRAQMQYLYDNGYTTIDLYDLSRAITDQQELPPKPIVLTFDDGYLDNYQNAYPILEEFGFEATFFIPTEFIDFGRAGHMTWPMIEEMAAKGHRFEPHSRTHPDLRNRSQEFLIWEILGPQETLAAHIGYTPRYFAYPSGRYDDKVIQTLRDLHFWGAVTTAGGTLHGFENRYEWTRLRVAYSHSMQDFINRVEMKDTVGGKQVDK